MLNDEVNTLEEKYSALTETTADAIISTDREDRIAFCNPSAMKMFGYNEKIIGMPSTILMPERYRTIQRRNQEIPRNRNPQSYRGNR